MANLTFNGIPLSRSDASELYPELRSSYREQTYYFIHPLAAKEMLGLVPQGSFARHVARFKHYRRLLRPKHKRGHRKYRDG